MSNRRRAAICVAEVGDGSTSASGNVDTTSFARNNHASVPRRKGISSTISRPIVAKDDVIIISSDSEDDMIIISDDDSPSSAVKSKVVNQRVKVLSQGNERLKRQLEQLPSSDPGRGKKRVLDADEDEEKYDNQRLHQRMLQTQAENQHIHRKLVAAEKEVKELKKELKDKNVSIEGLHQLIECEICMTTLWQPWALSNCGHTFCKTCLISLFNARMFRCPTCRVSVRNRPVQAFALKGLVRAIAGPVPNGVDTAAEDGHIWDNLPLGGCRHGHNAHVHRR